MDDEKVNPLTAHLLNVVQGRQQTEIAKLSLLTLVTEKLDGLRAELQAIHRVLERIDERQREK